MGVTVCALAISVAGGTQALSQDAGPAYDWDGLFVGLHTGYGWSDTDVSRDRTRRGRTRNNFSTQLELDGLLGGIQVGYNYQHNDFVFGVIGDIALTGMSDSGASFRRPRRLTPPVSFESEYDWLATIRGRAGWLINDQTLLYAHGGLAIANMSTDFSSPARRVNSLSLSGNDTGWVAGAGIETALSDRVSIFAEYSHFDFGSGDSVTFGPGRRISTVTYSADNNPIDTIKIGVNFKLWRPGN
ncbi:outer membrane protein [Hoeflea prorocentri]|uniref:Porin family protein n=1 Tax=Hoeflea prorocentri TaxID=1922333 RepID=A0A9X3UIW5_9HYPH|nr:outer membrane protein [Hoeflea prorocentri]MCY6380014.1 porin family protein [Hoeflea prorocentri]MDA5397814.1 porin family protein [Hoeflea prorocentri]